jgi:hypothetical protein
MATKFSQIPVGNIFEADGSKFRKVDDLYYEDPSTGFQSMWNPIFDDSIARPPIAEKKAPLNGETNISDKFLVDTQTRVMKPNPNYQAPHDSCAAEQAFAEMWGTALFDCGPEDYGWMATNSIRAVNLVSSIIMILTSVEGSPDKRILPEQVESIINKWADKIFYSTPVKKAATKKKTKKPTPAKKVATRKGK